VPAPAGPDPELGSRCERIADHLLAVMRAEIPAEMKDELAARQAEDRPQIVAECVAKRVTAAAQDCLLAARTLRALGDCEVFASQGPAPSASEPAEPAEPADRKHDPDLQARCERIVAHVFSLMARELPPEGRDQMLRQMDGEKRSVVEACERERVGAEQEACALAAATVADLDRCSP
jgi:hypothetical protein